MNPDGPSQTASSFIFPVIEQTVHVVCLVAETRHLPSSAGPGANSLRNCTLPPSSVTDDRGQLRLSRS